MLFVSYIATQCQTFDFKLRRDHQKKKKLDEHSAYESVDDGSTSWVKFRKDMEKNS